jgi:pyroglutamyl-peptidase
MASRSRPLSITILVTGFGPFPGAPFNPTGPLVERLARLRRPALADIKIIPHVFPTSYAAVDRELPELIAKHKPRALLMFGLAARTKSLRIETRARNALALLPDVSGQSLRRNSILPGGPATLALPAHTRSLLAAARNACVPVVLSRDAGRYLCNYLCWRAAEASREDAGPRMAAFVHVPAIAHTMRPKAGRRRLGLDDLTHAGGRILLALAAAARR